MTRALETPADMLAIALIRGYQRYVSPHKGYVCARRARYGGESCSEFARRVIGEEGWRVGLGRLAGRFRECHAASRPRVADRAGASDGSPGGLDEPAPGARAGAHPAECLPHEQCAEAGFWCVGDAALEGCWSCGAGPCQAAG